MKWLALLLLPICQCTTAVRLRSASVLRTGATQEFQLGKPFEENVVGILNEGPHYPEIRLRALDVVSVHGMVRKITLSRVSVELFARTNGRF